MLRILRWDLGLRLDKKKHKRNFKLFFSTVSAPDPRTGSSTETNIRRGSPLPVVAGVPEKSGLVKGGRSITTFQIWNEHMTYLLQGKLLLRSHACHGVDHGGGQGGAGHHRVVGHRRHWRLRQRRLAVVRRLLIPLGCCRVRHVWNRVLGG